MFIKKTYFRRCRCACTANNRKEQVGLILFLSSQKHWSVTQWEMKVRIANMICNEPHAVKNLSKRVYSEMSLFRGCCFTESHTFAAFSCFLNILRFKTSVFFSSFVFISNAMTYVHLFKIYLKTVQKKRSGYTDCGTLVSRLEFYKYTKTTIHNPIWLNWSTFLFFFCIL